MSYTVRVTDTAKQDLREIAFWIAEKSKDREIAKRFVGELREVCKKLDTFPNAGGIPKDRMALHADPSTPASIDDWLDQFEMFSIYEVLPEILELWGSNLFTDVKSAKN